MVNGLMAEELEVLRIEEEIQHRVQNEVDRSQREFYLREQMKAIQDELGEGDLVVKGNQGFSVKNKEKRFSQGN
jgi:ATP-dependent Lon protease